MMRPGFLLMLAAALTAAACGDDSGGKDSNANRANNGANNGGGGCSLELPLEGAVSKTLSWGSSQGCAGATSGGLVTLTYGSFGGESVVMGFTDTMFGEPGTHETYVRYGDEDDAEWTAQDCTVDITTNEVVGTDPDFGDTYRFAGTGSCSGPATPTAGDPGGDVMVGDFAFSNDAIPGPN